MGKRKTVVLLITGLILLLLSASASADKTDKCGPNLKYTYTSETETLRIYGTGEMYNYSKYESSPFTGFWRPIKHLIIEEGVTSIGSHAFSNGYTNRYFECATIIIPSSVKAIGSYAFSWCPKLKTVIMQEGVKEIGEFAFGCDIFDYSDNHPDRYIYLPASVNKMDVTALFNARSVYYAGNKAQWEKLNQQKDVNVYYSVPALRKHSGYEFYGTWIPDGVYSYKTKKTTSASEYKNKGAAVIKIQSNGTITVNGNEGQWKLVGNEIVVDGESIGLSMTNDGNLFMRIDKENILIFKNTEAIITLPSHLKTVKEEAFANTKAAIYIVPEGVVSIKERGFANLSKAAVICLPSTLSQIAETAFAGTNAVTFVCPNTECMAYTWLKDHGMNVITE